MLAVFVHRLPEAAQALIHRFNHALISGVGLLAACTASSSACSTAPLTTPGLEINLAWALRVFRVGGVLIASTLCDDDLPAAQGEPRTDRDH